MYIWILGLFRLVDRNWHWAIWLASFVRHQQRVAKLDSAQKKNAAVKTETANDQSINEEKAFECGHCGKAFSTQEKVNGHKHQSLEV